MPQDPTKTPIKFKATRGGKNVIPMPHQAYTRQKMCLVREVYDFATERIAIRKSKGRKSRVATRTRVALEILWQLAYQRKSLKAIKLYFDVILSDKLAVWLQTEARMDKAKELAGDLQELSYEELIRMEKEVIVKIRQTKFTGISNTHQPTEPLAKEVVILNTAVEEDLAEE